MHIRPSSTRLPVLAGAISLIALMAAACNKHPSPSATEAPIVAPPAAALPMATTAEAPVAAAPPASALPPAPPLGFAPRPAGQRYGDLDRAYSMSRAFADTPPDYVVDYQGTRPWIWRARNGAYRIVERLPRGLRYYYYQPGQDYPFLVRDPDYSYAYNNGALAGVYGPDGSEIPDTLAARRAEEASRYLYRARRLYRAAQDEQRQSAYASEWAKRRDDLRTQEQAWQQEQSRNADWRSWHDSHAAQEEQQWRQERDQRAAYAAAIGIAGAAIASGAGQQSHPAPNPAELAQRQANYFSNWKAAHAKEPATSAVASKSTIAAPAPERHLGQPPTAPPQNGAAAQQAAAAADQAKIAQAKAAEAGAAQSKAAEVQRREAAAAKAKAAQAERAQQLAAQAKQKEAAAATAKGAEAQKAQSLASQAMQHQAAAARAKAAEAKATEAKAGEAKAAEAKVAAAKAAQAHHAEQIAAQAKEREAAAAKAKADEAKAAQAKAAEAKAAELKASDAKSAEAKVAQAKKADAHRQAAGKPGGGDEKKRGHSKDQKPDNQS